MHNPLVNTSALEVLGDTLSLTVNRANDKSNDCIIKASFVASNVEVAASARIIQSNLWTIVAEHVGVLAIVENSLHNPLVNTNAPEVLGDTLSLAVKRANDKSNDWIIKASFVASNVEVAASARIIQSNLWTIVAEHVGVLAIVENSLHNPLVNTSALEVLGDTLSLAVKRANDKSNDCIIKRHGFDLH